MWDNSSGGTENYFGGLAPSTCYDITVRTRVDCNNNATHAPDVPVYSSEQTINRCTKPSPCQLISVEAMDLATVDYQFKIEIEIDTITDHVYNLYRDDDLFAENLTAADHNFVDDAILAGADHCYTCTARKNGQ